MFLQKIIAILLGALSFVPVLIDGNVTFAVLGVPFALYLLFSRTKWVQ